MPPKVDKLVVTTNGKPSQSISSAEVKCKTSYYDKQSGSYDRVTTKESVSSGDYSNRGRVGYKEEYKSSSTERVGDKRGYTEYSKQEKFTRVDYDGGKYHYVGNQICDADDGSVDSDGSRDDNDNVSVDPDGSCDDDDTVSVDPDGTCDDDNDTVDDFYDDGAASGDDYDNDDYSDDGGCDDSYDSDDY